MLPHVSILVLLEGALRATNASRTADAGAMFQSLFYWKVHCERTHLFRAFFLSGVSILVLLEGALRGALISYGYVGWGQFQSLFYWKVHCENITTNITTIEYGFQSLFYWKVHCELLPRPGS